MIDDRDILTTLEQVFAVFGEQEPCDFAAFDDEYWWYSYKVSATIDGRQVEGLFHMRGMQKPYLTQQRWWAVKGKNTEDTLLLLHYIDDALNAVELPQREQVAKVTEPRQEIDEDFERRLRFYEIHLSLDNEYRELQRERRVGVGLGW